MEVGTIPSDGKSHPDLAVLKKEDLIMILATLEWHHQRGNYGPECPLCLEWEDAGHSAASELAVLLTNLGMEVTIQSPKGEATG